MTNLMLNISMIGIFLMPFMSLPVMPTDYRPISSILLFFPGLICLANKMKRLRLKKEEFLLLIFFSVSLVQSIVCTAIAGLGLLASLRGLFPILLGVLTYFALKKILEEKTQAVYRVLYLSSIFVTIIGLLELLSMYGVIPYAVKSSIGAWFSGLVNDRFQLTTQEASWAARVLIFSISILYYAYVKENKLFTLFFILINATLLIMSFSLDGFIIIFLYIFAYFIFIKKVSLASVCKLFLATITLGYSVYFVFLLLIGDGSNVYYLARMNDIANIDFSAESISIIDGSTFIRVFYPLIALKTFFDHPLGVGSGNFPLFFNYYLVRDYSFAPGIIDEVAVNFSMVSGTPKSLYARIFAEHGIISGGFFFLFIVWHIKKAFKCLALMKTPETSLNASLLLLALLSIIQFGSFAYVYLWFSLAYNAVIYEKISSIKIN